MTTPRKPLTKTELRRGRRHQPASKLPHVPAPSESPDPPVRPDVTSAAEQSMLLIPPPDPPFEDDSAAPDGSDDETLS